MEVGIDEVGRGAWAGPLVFAGVSLNEDFKYNNLLKDSKLLNRKQRKELSLVITSGSIHKISVISAKTIDNLGLTKSSEIACLEIYNFFKKINSEIIITIDGDVNYLKQIKNNEIVKTMIKADSLIDNVMAASILAKHYRDNLMIDISKKFSIYDFKNNVGYGTNKHQKALLEKGVCSLHRQSFKPIQKIL